ncbi:MAG: rubrerythrin family protein, partial [Micromonosporaceae bacterium]
MKTTTRRAAILAVAGALGLGGLALAAPAVAGANLFGGPAAVTFGGPGWADDGTGMGMGGSGMNRAGNGNGMGARAWDGGCLGRGNLPAKGTLTEQQKTTLAAMAQEEKLAHDLY